MAKFSMKDYEDFMEEEKRQDQLQEDLEDKNTAEYWDTYENWQDWQEEQREEEYRQKQEDCDFESDWDYDPLYDYYWWDYDDCDDDDCDDDDCDDDDLADDLYNSYSKFYTEDIVSEWRIANKSDERNQQEDRICRKAVARNRYLSKAKARNAKAQNAIYVAEREFRKCSRQIRKLDREYLKLSNQLYSDIYFTYSKSQSITKKLNIILDQLHSLHDKAVYFKGILEMSEYKQALSAPKAM